MAVNWLVLSTRLELYAGVIILIIALLGCIYMFLSGQWDFDDFMKGS